MIDPERELLNQIRHQLEGVRPTIAEERRYLRNLERFGDGFVGRIMPQKRQYTRALLEQRSEILEEYGRRPSNAYLCSQALVIGMADPTFYIARQGINPVTMEIRDPLHVIFYYDMANGIEATLNSIGVAERDLEGQSEQALALTVSEDPDVAEAAETYLMYQPWLDLSKEFAKLLTEDQTGFRLIDVLVERLREVQQRGAVLEPPLYHSFQVVSFVLGGAELARLAYRTLYPIAEQLPPIR